MRRHCHTNGVSATILDREMYTEAAAARLLRVAPSTLTSWASARSSSLRSDGSVRAAPDKLQSLSVIGTLDHRFPYRRLRAQDHPASRGHSYAQIIQFGGRCE